MSELTQLAVDVGVLKAQSAAAQYQREGFDAKLDQLIHAVGDMAALQRQHVEKFDAGAATMAAQAKAIADLQAHQIKRDTQISMIKGALAALGAAVIGLLGHLAGLFTGKP